MDAAETIPAAPADETPIVRPPQPIVRWILGVSLLLGIAGDGLLRALPLGINAPLFVSSLCLCLIWGWRRHRERTACGSLLVIAFLLSLCLAFRDAPVLHGLDIIAIIVIMLVLGTRPTLSDLHSDALSSLLTNVLRGTGRALKAPFLLLSRDSDWALTFKGPHMQNKLSVLRGLLVALPTLLIFVCLFSMADAVFRHMIETFLDNIVDSRRRLGLHVLWTLLFFVMVTGVIRPTTLGKRWERLHVAPSKRWLPGQVELVMVMGSVLAVFLVFIVIQFRYLFGGHNLVKTIPGLTYATYARKGFFALLLIVFVVHAILLLGAWLVAGTDRRVQLLYRGLSLALAVLTTFVFTSACYRLYLYVEAYGLTQSRLYAAAVLLWLAVVFLILILKITLPQWRFFTGSYVYSFLAVLLLLNAANPDGLVARINLQRSVNEHPLDTAYLQGLSTDAIPTILHRPSDMSQTERDLVASYILTHRTPTTDDWRSWNHSRANAQRLLVDK